MENKLKKIIFLLLTAYCSLLTVAAQTPTVEKVEPPSWWTNSSVKTVRVMLRGTNFSNNAKVLAPVGSGLQAANMKASANGHYLFFDVNISESTRVGKYNFKIQTDKGATDAPFEIFQPLPRTGNFQGFLPDDVIYFLMTDRFSDGDASNNDPAKSKGLYDRKMGGSYHGGDLQGVINHLEYIKSLGATAIVITPVYDDDDKSGTNEIFPEVSDAIDFYGVDEHLGDLAKLREFVKKAHQNGLIVLQDQVVNHVSPDHIWADDPPTPTWINGTPEKHHNNNGQKWTAMNPRATYQTQERNIDGWLLDILPDLNQNDAEVEKYLIQNTLWWIANVGFDAVRMETLPHVPRTFWAKWMTALKAEFPKVNVLGELFDGDPALLAYFQGGRVGHDKIDTKIDTLYDFALFYQIRNAFAKGEPIRGVSQVLAHDWLYPNPRVLTTFLGVHDMERFMNEKGATVEGLKLAQTFIMTTRGTPLLYYGDEIAMSGSNSGNRRDFPGGFSGDAKNAFTSAGRTAPENEVWNHLAKLGALRKELKPLQKGESFDLLDKEQQMAYARVFNNEVVLIVFNNDTKATEITFDVSMIKQIGANAILTDRLGKISDVKINGGIVKFTMPARIAGIFTVK